MTPSAFSADLGGKLPPIRVLLLDGGAEAALQGLGGDGFVVERMGAGGHPDELGRRDRDVALGSLAALDQARVRVVELAAHCAVPVVLVLGPGDDAGASVDAGAFDGVDATRPAALRDALRRAAEHRRRSETLARHDRALERRRAELGERAARIVEREDELVERTQQSQKLRQLVVHDLKNQIAVVKSNLSYVLEEALDDPRRALLVQAEAAIDQVLGLSVGVAQIAPQLVAARAPVALRALLVRVAREQQVLGGPSGGPVVTVEASAAAEASIDEVLVHRALANLVDNALRHAGARSIRLVAGRSDGGEPMLSVEDDGVGVPASVRSAVGDASAGSRVGLGLRCCRAVAAAHGGRVWIDERVARGTAVRLTLGSAASAVSDGETR